MKKYVLIELILAMLFCSLSSCVTSSFISANVKYEDARKAGVNDLSDYPDYKLENFKFPDGKITTAYVFKNVGEAVVWQNLQMRKYYSEWQQEANKKYEEYMKKAEELENKKTGFKSTDKLNSSLANDYREMAEGEKWYPTGPLSPFFKAVGAAADNNGGIAKIREMYVNNHPPVSYYNVEDLGKLSEIMNADSTALGCYEDSSGVYFLVISRPKYLSSKIVSSKMKTVHKNDFAYEISFVPKKFYEVPDVKLEPAKTTPYNPSVIPDSNRNFAPDIHNGSSAYYYDKTLAYNLQWIAVVVACKGKYDMAYTGDFYTRNPTDYYNTSYIKQYLAKSGKATRGTILFEGICFDYADFAYQEVKNTFSNVTDVYMVGTFNDSSNIIEYRIAEKGEKGNMTINGTPVVENGQNHVIAHENAKHHAWLWVRGTDGVIYWCDPTWTDNTGRPVYGIVRGDREIQLTPSENLCVN